MIRLFSAGPAEADVLSGVSIARGLVQSLEISSLDPELILALDDFRGLHNVGSSTLKCIAVEI